MIKEVDTGAQWSERWDVPLCSFHVVFISVWLLSGILWRLPLVQSHSCVDKWKRP